MNLKEFKNEFRLVCDDTWSTAMEAWFECAGRLYLNDIMMPTNWEYRPSAYPCDNESYWYELFDKSTNKDLMAIGKLLFRYCQYLKYKKIDY